MTENEAIQKFKKLLDVPCEMLVKYDSVTTEEQKKALVRIRAAEEMAIKALEKQIPIKPAYQGEHEKCPTCGSFCIDVYCAKCGQKIDWE